MNTTIQKSSDYMIVHCTITSRTYRGLKKVWKTKFQASFRKTNLPHDFTYTTKQRVVYNTMACPKYSSEFINLKQNTSTEHLHLPAELALLSAGWLPLLPMSLLGELSSSAVKQEIVRTRRSVMLSHEWLVHIIHYSILVIILIDIQ